MLCGLFQETFSPQPLRNRSQLGARCVANKVDGSKQISVGAEGSGRGWNISNSFISMQCYGAAIHQKFAPKVRVAAAKHLKRCYDSDYIPKRRGGRGKNALFACLID